MMSPSLIIELLSMEFLLGPLWIINFEIVFCYSLMMIPLMVFMYSGSMTLQSDKLQKTHLSFRS